MEFQFIYVGRHTDDLGPNGELNASIRMQQDAGRGTGCSACFVARNRFAVLDKNTNTIAVKNLQNETTKRCPSPTPTTDAIFYGGTGLVLCKSEDKMVMFDVQQRNVVGELSAPPVKYVVWNAEMIGQL